MLFNTERAREFMRRSSLDALIATSPVNITYFTDYSIWLDPLMKEYMIKPGGSSDIAQGFAIFPYEGAPALILTAPMLAVNGVDIWVQDLRVSGCSGLDWSVTPKLLPTRMERVYNLLKDSPTYETTTAALVEVLRDRGISRGRLGIEIEGLTVARHNHLRKTLSNANILDCSNLIRLVRMYKTQDEVDRLAQAAEISEIAAMKAMKQARLGENIQNVVNQFRANLGNMGADLDHFAFGCYGLGIATETNFNLGDSETEYVDWGCRYRSCYSDTGTTFAMGALTKDMQTRFDILRETMNEGRSMIRPGVNASAVQNAMQSVVKTAKLEMYPHGHGIGLEVRGYPILAPDNGLRIMDDCVDLCSDLAIEENMVLNIEAPLALAGVGSLHLEESVVVTEDGCRPLVEQQRGSPVFLNHFVDPI